MITRKNNDRFKKNDRFGELILFAGLVLFLVQLIFNIGCLQNEKSYPEIESGSYERSAIIDSTLFNFVFDFSSDKNFSAHIFVGADLISTETGSWEQKENLLCLYSKSINGCEKIRNVRKGSFELFDSEEKKWFVFRRTG